MQARRILDIVLAMAVFASAGVSCTKKGRDIEIVTADGSKAKLSINETLRIRIASEPPSLDWHKLSDSVSSHMTDNLMVGLTTYDLNDKELALKPALATKWESSDQARKWKFTLREGVVWSDGVPLTAQHVVDGFRRVLAKETASQYQNYLYGIKNAKPFSEGKLGWDEVGVKITSPNEITVELESSMSYFPYLLAHHASWPARMDLIQKHGVQWTEPGKMVTLGPFKLIAWEHDKMLAMERNDNYYGEKPAVKYIVAYMVQEVATAINLFDSGKIDAVRDLPSIELKKLRARKEFHEIARLSTYYYGINVKKPPMDNVKVRKAIAMAIDRQEIVQMLNGGQVPLTSWVPVGMFGYEPDRGTQFNPEKAREMMKEAGYADMSKFPKLEIKYNTLEDHQRIAENIQAQLKRNLGINVEIRNEEWKVYLNSLNADPPHLWRFGWLADYPDPHTFFSVLTSYSENNRTRWKNPKYDELVEKGAGALDKEERKKIYSQAQKIIVEDEIPVIPILSSVSHVLVSPRVEGYPANPMEKLIYTGVRLK